MTDTSYYEHGLNAALKDKADLGLPDIRSCTQTEDVEQVMQDLLDEGIEDMTEADRREWALGYVSVFSHDGRST